MQRVYVAGPYSDDNVMSILDNMRRGIEMSVNVLLAGMSPFCPWLDYQFSFASRGREITLQHYYDYSMAWVEASDAMLVVGLWETSKGTKAEIKRAEELGIPIFYSFDALVEWNRGN